MFIVFVVDTPNNNNWFTVLSFIRYAPPATHFCLRLLNDLLAYLSQSTSATKVILLVETVRRANESVLGTIRSSNLNLALQQYNLLLHSIPPCLTLPRRPCPPRPRGILSQHTACSSRKKMNSRAQQRNRNRHRMTLSNKRMGSRLRG